MSIYLDLSAYDLTNTAAVDRFKKVVAEAIAGRPTYEYSMAHSALAWKMFQISGADALAVKDFRAYMKDKVRDPIAAGGFPTVKFDSYLYSGKIAKNLALTIAWCGHLLTQEEITEALLFLNQLCYNLANYSKSNWGGLPDDYTDGIIDNYNGWAHNQPLNNYFYSHVNVFIYTYLINPSVVIRSYLDARLELLISKWGMWESGLPEGTGYSLSLASLFEVIKALMDATGEQFPVIIELAEKTIEAWFHLSIRDWKTKKFGEIVPWMDHSREARHRIYDGDRSLIPHARALPIRQKYKDMAAAWLSEISHTKMTAGNYCHIDMLDHGTSKQFPDEMYWHGKSGGQYAWRDNWTENATVVAYTCGPNNESHDQDDQGGFQLCHKGYWQAVTHNIWSKTGILNDPQWHNVLCFRDSTGKQVNQGTAAKNQCVMTVVNPQEVVMDISPAYLGKGITHTRTCKHSFNSIVIEDSFSTGAYEAIFQIHTPYLPIVDGNKITAGMTTWAVEEPANAVISVVDLKAATTFSTRGYRIEIRGGIDRYRVRGDIDTAMAPVELPGTTVTPTPTPEPSPDPDPIPEPTEPALHAVLPLWPPGVTHVLTGPRDGASWHYGDPRLWVPVEQITLQHYVATATNSQGTEARICRSLANLAAGYYVCMTTVPPSNLTARDVKGQMYATLIFPAQPEEDPVMIAELQAKITELESANEALVDQLTAAQTELESTKEQVVLKDSVIATLNQDISAKTAILEAQAPKIEKLATLESAIRIINEAA